MTAETFDWPVLNRYDVAHSLRVALPLGGIGTGTVSLGGRGDLRDWEVVNRPAKGFAPKWSFFALRTAPAGGGDPDAVVARALEGPIDLVLYEGGHGSGVPNHGLPRFRRSEFLAAYPFGQVVLEDPDVPAEVRVQAFNPLVPTDAEASGLPVAVLRHVVTNTADHALEVSVAGSVSNFVGTDGSEGVAKNNRNTVRQEEFGTGVLLTSDGVPRDAEQWGSLALVALGEDDVTTRTAWADHSWGGELLDFWDDFTADGRLEERTSSTDTPTASVAATRTLAPGETHTFTFLLGWHFPNRRNWDRTETVGNYYATKYADAWQVVADTVPALADLERRTRTFVEDVVTSDLPDVVQEAALANLSTLRTQTCFRTADGRFFGWEGCSDDVGCCAGSCTHVWNYEQATPFLFGALATSLREVELAYATGQDGRMPFRIPLPLERAATDPGPAAADGQMGCLVKLYREWRMSGDDDLLRALWPAAKRALAFAWIPGGWDADRDGVMEGSQHNTMDVEYFGPNPEVGVWYLAALRACEELATHLGETEFAATCADLFARGSAWLDEHLFNGEYYRHEIRPPGSEDAIAPGLRLKGIGARDLVNPELQIGDGCLADQLVGQELAHLYGLGDLLDPAHLRTTYASILRHNRRDTMAGHFNPMRSYTLGDEAGLVVASYPRGDRPERPFPYFDEVWSGLEYTAAVGMICMGMVDEGVGVIETTRGRYDGRRRNPFDEAECGHHYVRAMASWGAVPALTGFGYDGVHQALTFAAADETVDGVRWFWSNGWAWGVVEQTRVAGSDGGVDVRLDVREGTLRVRELTLTGLGSADLGGRTLGPGEQVTVRVPAA
ncbi:GH116 family glycosyl-hydrolase [Actinopolymorpha sp. NPDC004070]|uniref:GH116 family glycosyl-hydrolase n=1 Tax=Actinopolymorpha sp. NPDC004070 TaxID=3154548 RepID=UPI0033B9C45C